MEAFFSRLNSRKRSLADVLFLNVVIAMGKNPIYGLDGCYLHHIGRKYWDLIDAENGFMDTALASSPFCPFVSYYQFFRGVLFSLKKTGSFVLLHDERNPAFMKISSDGKESGLWPFLMEFVPAKHASSIFRVTIQQVVRAIEDSGRHQDWIGEFKEKYGIE